MRINEEIISFNIELSTIVDLYRRNTLSYHLERAQFIRYFYTAAACMVAEYASHVFPYFDCVCGIYDKTEFYILILSF